MEAPADVGAGAGAGAGAEAAAAPKKKRVGRPCAFVGRENEPRECVACRVVRPAAEFEGTRKKCHPCRALEARKARAASAAQPKEALPVTITCVTCKNELAASTFEMTPTGPRKECKPCRAARRKSRVNEVRGGGVASAAAAAPAPAPAPAPALATNGGARVAAAPATAAFTGVPSASGAGSTTDLLSAAKTLKDLVASFDQPPLQQPMAQQSPPQQPPVQQPPQPPLPEECIRCHRSPPEVKFKLRTDCVTAAWRSVCNDCFNAKGYYKVYREKKREADEAAYLANNARVQREWRKKNPEYMENFNQERRTEPSKKFFAVIANAKRLGVPCAEASEEVAAMCAKMEQACRYCGILPVKGVTLNGLDRIEPEPGFVDANTVTCCTDCNYVKNTMSADEFVLTVRRIVAHRALRVDVSAAATAAADMVVDEAPRRGSKLQRGNQHTGHPEKEKCDLLSIRQKIALWSAPCYLCGRGPALGIDRVKSDEDYTEANVKPCCTPCNYMKKDYDLGEFEGHMARIAHHTRTWALRDVTNDPLPRGAWTSPETNVVAVRFDTRRSGKVEIIFPSPGTATRVIGRSCPMFQRTPAEYRSQNLTADVVSDALTEGRRI